MDISVVAMAREDERPPDEPLRVAAVADRLGYPEAWVGEGPTWDAFALATAIGLRTERIALTVGPVPVSVRDPASIVRGAAGAAFLTGRRVGVALGASSVRVVEGYHGRSRAGVARLLDESARNVRELFDDAGPEAVPGSGFRRRLGRPGGPLTVAAFGERAVAAAARHADRMVLDLVTPRQVALARTRLEAAAEREGRTPPRLAAWLPAAVDPSPDSYAQLMKSVVGYLGVRGYDDMFTEAGFGDAVERAKAGAGLEESLAALPREAAATVGLVGDEATVRSRLAEYAAAGLDEVALVPATSGDPAGERTLTALAPGR
ncbi:LLM class F420-dependent oxidoreductase [Streptomyces hoynatensis]|uniref:LLM class F420-dependent oxidoreductase n=2 Tax=Streptomyces hoynatensis TaxID=1141874 RepID=A0A3A9YKR0_9ACTN|nr:LLM class F420-dependent oxidoreductase [Streptomyces hoynatensis]RKN37031.1 LLM class F420-dependent oxidoreductase [Streptomyces hoynatensis]